MKLQASLLLAIYFATVLVLCSQYLSPKFIQDQPEPDVSLRMSHTEFLKHVLAGERLPFKYMLQMLADVKEIFAKQDSLVYINTANSTGITVVGDLHGQFYDFANVLLDHYTGEERDSNQMYLFNGDLVDRGPSSLEIVIAAFTLKCYYPDRFFINRGNHELKNQNQNMDYGLLRELTLKYPEENVATIVHEAINYVFDFLPVASVIDNSIFVVHGGLPCHKWNFDLNKIKNINRVNDGTKSKSLLYDLLWSDPMESKGLAGNVRGAGCTFGPDMTDLFLNMTGLSLIIRSHQEKYFGYQSHHDGKCITVFSSPAYAGKINNYASVIKISPNLDLYVVVFGPSALRQDIPKTCQSKIGYYNEFFIGTPGQIDDKEISALELNTNSNPSEPIEFTDLDVSMFQDDGNQYSNFDILSQAVVGGNWGNDLEGAIDHINQQQSMDEDIKIASIQLRKLIETFNGLAIPQDLDSLTNLIFNFEIAFGYCSNFPNRCIDLLEGNVRNIMRSKLEEESRILGDSITNMDEDISALIGNIEADYVNYIEEKSNESSLQYYLSMVSSNSEFVNLALVDMTKVEAIENEYRVAIDKYLELHSISNQIENWPFQPSYLIYQPDKTFIDSTLKLLKQVNRISPFFDLWLEFFDITKDCYRYPQCTERINNFRSNSFAQKIDVIVEKLELFVNMYSQASGKKSESDLIRGQKNELIQLALSLRK